MRILITGASGLVGSALVKELYKTGRHSVSILTRNKDNFLKSTPFPVSVYEWDPENEQIDSDVFVDVDAVIHLAGENVASGRWTKKRRKRIYDSRILGTRLLIKKIKEMNLAPRVFISAGAVGIYGNGKDKIVAEDYHTEEKGFLTNVCREWEKELFDNEVEGLRKVVLRTGIVLSSKGGALAKMLPPFLSGVGGRLGDGRQFMSWIHIDDLVRMYIHTLENESIEGAYNAVSPSPEMNNIFTKKLGHVIKRPTIFPVPSFILKTIFGDMASILLEGQRVSSAKIEATEFEFKYTELTDTLSDLLGPIVDGESVLEKYQYISRDINTVFSFFSNEKNLEKLTPPYLNFKVERKTAESIQKDIYIDYKLKLYGIPLGWTSKIEEWEQGKKFVDVQVKGPYKKWHHTHNFYPSGEGTLMEDKIRYKIPAGIFGKLFLKGLVDKNINKIFDYRKLKVEELV